MSEASSASTSRSRHLTPWAKWRFTISLTVAALVSALGVATAGTGAEPPAGAPSQGSTPVVSARRAPDALIAAVADGRLRARLAGVVSAPDLAGARDDTCLRVVVDGRTVVDIRPDQALVPASNLKIFTALAALAELGPDSRLRTSVRITAASEGVVAGPLWLVGGGDPLLATSAYAASFRNQPQVFTPMEALADAVVAAGVKQIDGPVLGDETRYDSQRYLPTWRPSYISDHEIGPMSALAVNDGFAQFDPVRVAASEPAASAAATLADLLVARGVQVSGGAGVGRAPAGPELAGVDSKPVAEIVAQMLRESDNYTAELLVKELGHRRGEGSTASGLKAMHDILGRQGVPLQGFEAADGSGLDRSDRATCASVAGALAADGHDGPLSRGFPVAGRSGTLSDRFEGGKVEGRLRAKTGSLNGVTALSGYLGPRPILFSLIANDLPDPVARGQRLQEQVVAALAAYPDAPPREKLMPR